MRAQACSLFVCLFSTQKYDTITSEQLLINYTSTSTFSSLNFGMAAVHSGVLQGIRIEGKRKKGKRRKGKRKEGKRKNGKPKCSRKKGKQKIGKLGYRICPWIICPVDYFVLCASIFILYTLYQRS